MRVAGVEAAQEANHWPEATMLEATMLEAIMDDTLGPMSASHGFADAKGLAC